MGIRKDWTGQKFGMLTFLEPTEERVGRTVVWKIRCDCGSIVLRPSNRIVFGSTKSCGCLRSPNWTGQKIGMLTFIRPTDNLKNGETIWELQCDCGKVIFKLHSSIGRGKITSCGCWKKRKSIEVETTGVKTCTGCGDKKPLEDFHFWSKERNKRRPECNECSSLDSAERYQNAPKPKQKCASCGETKLLTEFGFLNKNIGERKLDCKLCITKAKEPSIRLRKNISIHIAHVLKEGGSIKNKSFLKAVSYSMEELRRHLERQFDPWMDWSNYGKYSKGEWQENDLTTWTWSLDHIIPQSDLPYTSMEDENFKKCWALENLRPLSSKQNLIDGVMRSRHQ